MISLFVLFACGAEKSDVESDCPTYEGSFPVSNDSGVLSETQSAGEDAETVYDVQGSISIVIDNDEHTGLE